MSSLLWAPVLMFCTAGQCHVTSMYADRLSTKAICEVVMRIHEKEAHVLAPPGTTLKFECWMVST